MSLRGRAPLIMAAVALGLVEAFRVQTGSNVARGMFLLITYTAALFDKMIIAGASSIAARGLIEKAGEVDVLWSLWFVAFLPCDVVTVVAAWALTLWLFPPGFEPSHSMKLASVLTV